MLGWRTASRGLALLRTHIQSVLPFPSGRQARTCLSGHGEICTENGNAGRVAWTTAPAGDTAGFGLRDRAAEDTRQSAARSAPTEKTTEDGVSLRRAAPAEVTLRGRREAGAPRVSVFGENAEQCTFGYINTPGVVVWWETPADQSPWVRGRPRWRPLRPAPWAAPPRGCAPSGATSPDRPTATSLLTHV